MPGDLKIEKKAREKKQTNKQTKNRKVRPLDFVIMENEICAASKHVPVVQKVAMRGAIYKPGPSCSNVRYRYPSDKLHIVTCIFLGSDKSLYSG